jgi:hypothetical protein
LSVGYLAGSLTDELRSALQTYVGSKSVQDLYSNTQIRQEVERQMQLELEPVLERIGLEMVQLRFVDFLCPAYDPIREKEAELYIDTRDADIDIDRLKLAQRLRKAATTDKMDLLKTEKDFEDFVRQTEHELGLKDIIRDDEMDKLKCSFAHQRDMDVVTHEIEIEGIKSDAAREEAKKDFDAKIEAFLKKKDAQRKAEAEDSDEDIRQARAAVDLREKTQQVELDRREKEDELEARRLQERSKASAQALISILDGDAADRIMKLEDLRAKEKLTPDQIIAMTAATSPQVAQVLAEKYKAEAAINEERFNQLREFVARQEETSKESADRLERVMNAALQQMGSTATTRAQAPQSSQTVVTPGGMGGAPVVINPQGPAAEKTCPKCKKMVPSDSRFCPNCREKL